jgi:aspartyl-tRNA(Asn)/glutamyl-tRNA(Gln) amidotransferase subunit B
MPTTYETVIGLEIHCELNTRTKVFCRCSTEFGGEPNTHTCPICTAMPGTLPVLNLQAVEKCVTAGLALGCDINRYSNMDRKNYFYPDLPKAYQISQLHHPLCTGGLVKYSYEDNQGTQKEGSVRINRIHLEEDAGKSLHDAYGRETLLDFNRCGVPLIEIVTEPDLHSAEEAGAFVEAVRSILQFAGVSDCRMQEGSLRADVNLSIRPYGAPLGTRTEMKNLNSLKAIVRAARAEAQRQIELIEEGNKVSQETRRWDDNKGRSLSMRSKEEANDYRYFPDPDLLPIVLDESWMQRLVADLPELPEAKRARYTSRYGLSEYDAAILTTAPGLAQFFEEALQYTGNAKAVANLLMGDIMRRVKADEDAEFTALPFPPADLAELVNLIDRGIVNSTTGKAVLDYMFGREGSPTSIVEKHGLVQVSDDSTLREAAKKVVAENLDAVLSYNAGKDKAFSFIMGQMMRETKGKADPEAAKKILLEEMKNA